MAEAFQFRLQSIERLRRHERDAQRRIVAMRRSEVLRIEHKLDDLTERMSATKEELRGEARLGSLDMASLCELAWYRVALDREKAVVLKELEGAQSALAPELQRLKECSTRLKAIEKLRERQWERFQEEQRRAEQQSTDESAVQRFLRGCQCEGAAG